MSHIVQMIEHIDRYKYDKRLSVPKNGATSQGWAEKEGFGRAGEKMTTCQHSGWSGFLYSTV